MQSALRPEANAASNFPTPHRRTSRRNFASGFSSFCVAQWCSARVAIHEACRVLPDTHVLRGVLRALGIVPGYPTYAKLCTESILYLRFSPVKMACGDTRFRKYKQVLEDKLVSAELSLRYWAQQENFRAWVSIPVSERVTPELLRGREQALIQTLQPRLNFLSLLGGFALAKASSSLQMPPLPERPAFSDFGGKNGGSRR